VTFPYEQWRREESLWYCLKQHKLKRVPDRERRKETDDKANVAFAGRNKTDLPPSPANHPNTDRERTYRLEVKKYRIEIATLVAVIIYAGLTYYLLKTARETFTATQRAWVGIYSVNIERTHVGKIGPQDVQFQTTFMLKNFGGSLATDIRFAWALANNPRSRMTAGPTTTTPTKKTASGLVDIIFLMRSCIRAAR
jgi:hypothetical protein